MDYSIWVKGVHRETEGTERVWEEDRKGLVDMGRMGA